MALTVGDHLLKRLQAWGVRRVFGYSGDGINGVVGAFARQEGDASEQIEFVQARHEELAAFMACGHAKYTGEVGVCLATSGPGAIHLLNGLYDAKMDHQPVVAIVGQQARAALGGAYQQEVDLQTLFKDVASDFVQMATTPEQVRHLIDRAVRIARDQRTVTCVILPNDLQEMKAVEAPPREHGTVHTGIDGSVRAPLISGAPADTELRKAAEILNAGKKVAILVGAGALNATDEVIAVADLLGAGVAKALLGKAAVPDDLPFVTGSIGLLGTEPSWQLMNGCDTLLMIGSGFPYSEYLPEEGKARGVQIDIDARQMSLRYPMEHCLLGDSRATLRALLPLLDRKVDRTWRDEIEANVAKWWEILRARAMEDANPINPQRVYWELSPRLPADAILSFDSGSGASWLARDVKLGRGMMCSVSGGLASMGCGLPYALAAKLAHPGRPVIALVGDGAMQMLGINALVTVSRLWKQWADPRFIVMVLNNGDLNMVTWEQRITEGDPKYAPSQDLPGFAYADYAKMLGLVGLRVTKPEEVGPAWDAAFASKVPVVLDMVVDPDVPPLPPHVTVKQTKAFLSAMLHRDPDAIGVIRESAKQWWASHFK